MPSRPRCQQGDLQIFGSLAVAARREQVEEGREELRDEGPDHPTSASVYEWMRTA